MEILNTKKELQAHLQMLRQQGETVGLVPTMGALHEGHLSLLNIAQQRCSKTVVTIFVNPTQFTRATDLENYPRPIVADIARLTAGGCDVLFMPGVAEMYTTGEAWHIELGPLEHLLEGQFRPGHYQGVTQIVYKLFDVIKPSIAFFGQKDYQQFLVINKMVNLLNMPVKLVMCPILREPEGLAMSSRNIHLTAENRRHALILSKALGYVQKYYSPAGMQQLQKDAQNMIENESGVNLDYFEIADADTLEPAIPETEHIIALTAAQVGTTRLIDNMIIR